MQNNSINVVPISHNIALRIKSIFSSLFIFLVFSIPVSAQVIFTEDFELWIVGTSFIEDPENPNIYAFYDVYAPAGDNYIWTAILDENFDSLALNSSQDFFESGVKPFDFNLDNTLALFTLNGVFSQAGIKFKFPSPEFGRFKVDLDYQIINSTEVDTLYFTFSSSTETREILREFPAVEELESVSFEFDLGGGFLDSIELQILKQSPEPSHEEILIDNLVLSLIEPSKDVNVFQDDQLIENVCSLNPGQTSIFINRVYAGPMQISLIDPIGKVLFLTDWKMGSQLEIPISGQSGILYVKAESLSQPSYQVIKQCIPY